MKMKRDRDVGFAVIAALILLVEAVLIIAFSPNHILGGDGPEYATYAHNLVDHGVFSRDVTSPFEPSVYRTPGYPLFLAGLRLIGGNSVLIVRVVQFLLLGLVAYLVYAIALEVAYRLAARLAALICVTYLPFLWLARMHLTETLTTALLSAIILLLVRVRKDPKVWRFVAVGVLVALTALVRPAYALAIAPVALGAVLWRGPLSVGQAVRYACVLVAAFALVLVPWTVRNFNLTHQVRPFGTGGGGLSLFASAKQYQGTAGYRWDAAELHRLFVAAAPALQRANRQAAAERSDVPLSVRQEIAVDRNLRAEARATLHRVSILDALGTIPKRIAYLWAVSDYPGTSHYAAWHNLARLEHFALLALALVGLVLGLTRLGLGVVWPIALFPAYLTLVHLAAHSEGRYSVPARPALIVFAALAADYVWMQIAGRSLAASAASSDLDPAEPDRAANLAKQAFSMRS